MKRCIERNVYALIMCFTLFIGIQMAESWRGDCMKGDYIFGRSQNSQPHKRTIRAHILSPIPPAYYFLLR